MDTTLKQTINGFFIYKKNSLENEKIPTCGYRVTWGKAVTFTNFQKITAAKLNHIFAICKLFSFQ